MIHVPHLPIRPSPSRQGDSWMLTILLVSESIPFAFGWTMITNWLRSHVDFHLKFIGHDHYHKLLSDDDQDVIMKDVKSMKPRTIKEDSKVTTESVVKTSNKEIECCTNIKILNEISTFGESNMYLHRETSSTSIIELDESTCETFETNYSWNLDECQHERSESKDALPESQIDTIDEYSHLSKDHFDLFCFHRRCHDKNHHMKDASLGGRKLFSWLSLLQSVSSRFRSRRHIKQLKTIEHTHVPDLVKALQQQQSSSPSIKEDTIMWA
jgi:uncharacterized protein (UPF0147 family)